MKKIYFKITLLFILTLSYNLSIFSQSLPNNVPSNGLVGWWSFSGNADDMSNNSINGTVYGSTLTEDRFGNINSAFSFDGIDDYILFPADLLPTNERTVSLWFYTDNISLGNSEGRALLGYGGNSCSTGGNAWCMTIDNLGNIPF